MTSLGKLALTNHYKRQSRKWRIADCLIRYGLSSGDDPFVRRSVRRTVHAELKPLVNVERPFFYKARGQSRDTWLPTEEAVTRLDYEIGQVITELCRTTPETSEPMQPVVPAAPVVTDQDYSPDEFLQIIWRARDIVREINRDGIAGGSIPDVGTRAIIDGAHAYRQDLPFKASVHALALDWSEQVRERVGVLPFDYSAVTMPGEFSLPEPVTVKLENRSHSILPTLARLILARRNVALIGPPGCGKTHIAAEIADKFGLPFGMLSMSGGVTRGDLTGTETISGFKARPFPEIFTGGGLFLFDELDAGNPRVVPVLNAALANEYWTNPATGEMLRKSDNFIALGAMNTLGNGSTSKFTARERQDAALLDRFAIGRVEIDYDRELEQDLFSAILSA